MIVASETSYHSFLTGTEIAAGFVFWAETSARPTWTRAMMRQMGELTPKEYAIFMGLCNRYGSLVVQRLNVGPVK